MRYIQRSLFRKMYNMKSMMYVSNHRKAFTKASIYGACLFLAATISFSPQYIFKNQEDTYTKPVKFPTDLKYILFFNPKSNSSVISNKRHNFILRKEAMFATGQTLFIKQRCPYINCFITYDHKLLQQMWNFDAIVYDIHVIKHKRLENINWQRSPYQKYIFRSMESASSHFMCHKSYDNFFNWTWTYRLDSDIPHPFIDVYDSNNTLVGPSTNITWIDQMKRNDRFGHKVTHKNKAVAWLVNNCKTKDRHDELYHDFKAELERYNYTLDIYGPCSTNACPKGSVYKCYKLIEKNYYFQLVTEDYYAEDYVTEKLVKSLQLVIIPIVVGGANYSRFLPPGTYLDFQEFDVKKMGAIIDYLIHNKTTYTYFFEWKNHYSYNIRPRNYVCDLCTKLNEDNSVNEVKTHFRKWWYPDYEDVCLRKRLYYKFIKPDSQGTESKS